LTLKYNRVLRELLDKHAPLQERTIIIRPVAPWYNESIKEEKQKRRKLERVWRESELTVHREVYKDQCCKVNKLVCETKREYLSKKIDEHVNDQKALFKITDTLLHKNVATPLPSHTSSDELANRFADYFTDKIIKIRADLESIRSNVYTGENENDEMQVPVLSSFENTTECEVKKIIMNTASKSYSTDPIPTTLLKDCIETLVPIITKIVNLSFCTGSLPEHLKEAVILPLIKKLTLCCEVLKNFRPVSNLQYLSKIIERVVAARLIKHMTDNNLKEPLQSAYCKYHSTETAVLKVQNDILCALDVGESVILVLLDLSAAFDTVDHQTLKKTFIKNRSERPFSEMV
jgi:hypothetical protein